MSHGPTAGELLTTVLAELVDDLHARRPAALADEPDAVHQLRTTVRRQRNLLAAFRRCFDATAALELGAALASYGALLGECRDLEVRVADAEAALAALALPAVEDAEVRAAVLGPLRAGHARAHDAMVGWHAGPGVVALDALLSGWVRAPELAKRARRPADAVARKAVRRQVRRVLARAEAGEAEQARHALRKAARRLRHTADAVAAVDPDGRARAVGRLGRDVQGALGDHRDALLLADHVRRCVPEEADRASYDLLVAHAEGAAEQALRGLDEPLAALREVAVP